MQGKPWHVLLRMQGKPWHSLHHTNNDSTGADQLIRAGPIVHATAGTMCGRSNRTLEFGCARETQAHTYYQAGLAQPE